MSDNWTKQKFKQRIDTGEIGNANSGDILFDGGVKLNENLDALYNVFGDIRLYEQGEQGVGRQILHATGYYQHFEPNFYSAGQVEPGSRHDLNTNTSTFTVNLPTAKRGEMVEFFNSNGSFKTNPIIFKPEAGCSIVGKNELKVSSPYVHVSFICINDTPNASVWDYRIAPMFGDFSVPVDIVEQISSLNDTIIDLFDKTLYTGIKLIVSAEGIVAGNKERTMSEILLMIDPDTDEVYANEYSVVFKNKKIYDLTFSISRNQVSVTAKVPADAGTQNVRMAIKSIETIKASN